MKTNQFKVTLGLTKYALRAILRNRGNLFFSLVFPLVFIAIFGLISNGSSQSNLGIASTVSHSSPLYRAVESIATGSNSPISITTGSQSDLEAKLAKGNLDAVLEPGTQPNTLTLATSGASMTGGATIQGILSGVIDQLNLQAAGVTTPTFSLANKDISGRSFSYIDYVLPGQIGFSLIQIATFGVAFPFLTLRKTLVLKRIFATGVKPLSFIISQGLSRSVQALLQVSLLLAVGVKFFHFDLAHGTTTFLTFLLLAFLGVIGFLGFGLLISNVTKDEQSMPTVLNLFTLPQIMLAGVYFPVTYLPVWLQKIGNNLPLAYLTTAMRNVANSGDSLLSHYVWPYLLGLLVWALIAYFFAARTFKSE